MIALLAILMSAPASAVDASNSSSRFTLSCESQNPKAPIPKYLIDVNLDRRSYYVDTQFGGLDEVDAAYDDRILFRRNGRDVHGLPMFVLNEYDRSSGYWFYTVGSDRRHHPGTKPDAICSAVPAREHFKADVSYRPKGAAE
jgi:hypothetical protein